VGVEIVPARLPLLAWVPDFLFRIGKLSTNDAVGHVACIALVFVALSAVSRDHVAIYGQMPGPFAVGTGEQKSSSHTIALLDRVRFSNSSLSALENGGQMRQCSGKGSRR